MVPALWHALSYLWLAFGADSKTDWTTVFGQVRIIRVPIIILDYFMFSEWWHQKPVRLHDLDFADVLFFLLVLFVQRTYS